MRADAPMASYVVQRGIFRQRPVGLVDVGARGGYDQAWDVFQDQLQVIGFEPEPEECAALNEQSPPNVRYLPFALGAREETRTFFTAAFSGSSGLCGGDTEFIHRFFEGDNQRTVRAASVSVHPLDAVLREHGLESVDFLKTDCEGADLEVLIGAERTLRDVNTLGVLTEVWFQKQARECGYTFVDVHEYLSSHGFLLFDLDAYRYNRKAMPYPFLSDVRDEAGRLIAGQTTHGQVLRGDALYLRDYVGLQSRTADDVSGEQVLKLACIFEVFGLNDCAAELILQRREDLTGIVDTEKLLDFLTPRLKGKQFSYQEYLGLTESQPLCLRPSLRSVEDVLKRTAEAILRFDGRIGDLARHAFHWARRNVTGR